MGHIQTSRTGGIVRTLDDIPRFLQVAPLARLPAGHSWALLLLFQHQRHTPDSYQVQSCLLCQALQIRCAFCLGVVLGTAFFAFVWFAFVARLLELVSRKGDGTILG